MHASREIASPTPPLTVWFNTQCPVCDGGISFQKIRLARAAQSEAVLFRDINLEPDTLLGYGVNLNDVRRRLHGVDSNGRLYVGADCAIEIWRRTPGDRWLAALLGAPLIRAVTRFAYDRFADALFAWNRWKGRW